MSYTIQIKNNSGSVKVWAGKEFAIDEEFTLGSDTNRIRYQNNSNFLTAVSNGEALIGDGSQYFTDVNTALNWLKGFQPAPSAETIAAAPVLSSKLKIIASASKIDLNSSTSSYTSIYSYSGAGRLGGFILDFDSDRIQCKLEIDSNTVFDIDCDVLDDIFSGTPPFSEDIATWLAWDSSANKLIFKPGYPVTFSSNVTISAKANYDTTSRDCDRYIVSMTQES